MRCVLTPEVQKLLRRREAARKVDPVDFKRVFAEPAVEWIRGGAQPTERRLQIIGLEVDDGEIAAGSLLDPHGLSGDSAPLSRGLVSLLALAVRT